MKKTVKISGGGKKCVKFQITALVVLQPAVD